eukprot:994142-Amphidinium_carterae.1
MRTNDAVPGIENLQILWVRGRLVRLLPSATEDEPSSPQAIPAHETGHRGRCSSAQQHACYHCESTTRLLLNALCAEDFPIVMYQPPCRNLRLEQATKKKDFRFVQRMQGKGATWGRDAASSSCTPSFFTSSHSFGARGLQSSTSLFGASSHLVAR